MSAFSTCYTPLGKTCAEIASLANTLGACQADARVMGTVKNQLDVLMARLEVHLAAVLPGDPAPIAFA